jgi:hypothetical protein
MAAPISKEDALLCAGVVKEIAQAKGLEKDPGAIGSLTAPVARLYNRGMRDRDQLLVAAMQSVPMPTVPSPDARG